VSIGASLYLVETDASQLPASAREREAPLLHRINDETQSSALSVAALLRMMSDCRCSASAASVRMTATVGQVSSSHLHGLNSSRPPIHVLLGGPMRASSKLLAGHWNLTADDHQELPGDGQADHGT
jgi:hypothetical protein